MMQYFFGIVTLMETNKCTVYIYHNVQSLYSRYFWMRTAVIYIWLYKAGINGLNADVTWFNS